jgi:4-hydroxyphenylpyruvate dioxygenase
MNDIATLTEATPSTAEAGTFPVLGLAYVECWVGNARVAAQQFRHLGLTPTWYRGLETGSTETSSWVMSAGEVQLVLTGALLPDHPVAQFVRLHGDAVRDVALAVPDAAHAYELALARGATSALEPATLETTTSRARRSAIEMLGPCIHSLVSEEGDSFFDAAGFVRIDDSDGETAIEGVDHVALAIREGRLSEVIGFYRDVFGFAEMDLTQLNTITTDFSALMSKVIEGGGGKVKFPIVEAVKGPRRSQVEEFIDFNRGEGVQHLAFTTGDIVATAETFDAAGLHPLRVGSDYYEEARTRVPEIADRIDGLERHSILADKDEDGYLLQMFTEPIHDRPTLFFELIERHGSFGFGARNVRSLFEAIERSQLARGTL